MLDAISILRHGDHFDEVFSFDHWNIGELRAAVNGWLDRNEVRVGGVAVRLVVSQTGAGSPTLKFKPPIPVHPEGRANDGLTTVFNLAAILYAEGVSSQIDIVDTSGSSIDNRRIARIPVRRSDADTVLAHPHVEPAHQPDPRGEAR